MRKLCFIVLNLLLTLVLAASALANEKSYLGIFLQGSKIGYTVSSSSETEFEGKSAKRTDGSTIIDAGLLGAAMKTTIKSTTWQGADGKPMRMEFSVESAGRLQKVDATFLADKIELLIDNNGAKTTKSIDLPKDAPVVDDAVGALLSETVSPGTTSFYYVLDPMTAGLVKNEVRTGGRAKIDVRGTMTEVQVIEVSEPRATMKVYLSAKGDLLKVDGPMGMEMLPITEEEALAEVGAGATRPDLAEVNAIKPDRPITNPDAITRLTLRLSNVDLGRLPSDAFQTVAKDGRSWKVTIHPVSMSAKTTIAAARAQKPMWVKPDLNIPSESAQFRKLAAEVVGTAKTVNEAANRVHRYVFNAMRPNAGIGVLRDASEVWSSKEGVCRDYAILTCTLLRAAQVPARLVSGLVLMEGRYYYHAWVEAWDGANWVGVDSTRPQPNVGGTHLKLAQGTVEEAYTFTFLDRVRIEVLDARRRT